LKNSLENEGLSLGAFQVDVRNGESFSGSQETDDYQQFILPRQKMDEAQTEYDARQMASHNGSINLII
ncbi:MAG TPA: hypothetical protein VF857_09655, partial [Spirochaetota bacterium]